MNPTKTKVIIGENQVALVVSKDMAKYITRAVGDTVSIVCLRKMLEDKVQLDDVNELKASIQDVYSYLRRELLK